MYSQLANEGYKRMTRTVDLTGVTGTQPANLSFWTSYNTELDWDFVFVEAHTVGQNDWTTLPDQNGHTSQNTGASCIEGSGWGAELHNHLAHYQTFHENGEGGDDNTCDPTGTTGSWHAASGNSGGWKRRLRPTRRRSSWRPSRMTHARSPSARASWGPCGCFRGDTPRR